MGNILIHRLAGLWVTILLCLSSINIVFITVSKLFKFFIVGDSVTLVGKNSTMTLNDSCSCTTISPLSVGSGLVTYF